MTESDGTFNSETQNVSSITNGYYHDRFIAINASLSIHHSLRRALMLSRGLSEMDRWKDSGRMLRKRLRLFTAFAQVRHHSEENFAYIPYGC